MKKITNNLAVSAVIIFKALLTLIFVLLDVRFCLSYSPIYTLIPGLATLPRPHAVVYLIGLIIIALALLLTLVLLVISFIKKESRKLNFWMLGLLSFLLFSDMAAVLTINYSVIEKIISIAVSLLLCFVCWFVWDLNNKYEDDDKKEDKKEDKKNEKKETK